MFISPAREAVVRRFLSLVDDAGLPVPDEVEHWQDEVAFFWNEHKLVVIVELGAGDLTQEELLELVPAGFCMRAGRPRGA